MTTQSFFYFLQCSHNPKIPLFIQSSKIGFSHVLDLGWTEGHYQRSWQMPGLEKYGPLVNVDKASPPYGNTRRLITDCNVDYNPNRAHTAVIPGGTACKDSEGRFIHENVWLYLFTHPVDQTGEPDPANTK